MPRDPRYGAALDGVHNPAHFGGSVGMEIRRVLLVAPAKRDFWFPMPSVTLGAVAAAVPDGVEVRVLDGRVDAIDDELSEAREGDLVGLSFECFRAPRAYALAAKVRARGIPVIAGGAHPSAAPRDVLPHVDAVVRGEVEGLWQPILDDARRGKLRRVYAHRAPVPLDGLRPPRFDLLRRRRYAPATPIEATRGCPHRCGFCTSRYVQGSFRPIPVERVIAEVERAPTRWLVFMDDNLPASRPHAKRLFEAMKGLGKRFFVQTHVLMAEDQELLRLAADAGCRGVFVGLESVSHASLGSIDKTWNRLDRYAEWVERFHGVGIGVSAGIIFGLDEDDPSVFDRTLEFVDRIKVDAAAANLLVPFPGTENGARLEREGRVLDHDLEKYFGQYPLVQPLRMSVDQLMEGYRRFCESFYGWGRAYRRWRRAGLPLASLPLILGGDLSYRSWRAAGDRPVLVRRPESPALDEQALAELVGTLDEPPVLAGSASSSSATA